MLLHCWTVDEELGHKLYYVIGSFYKYHLASHISHIFTDEGIEGVYWWVITSLEGWLFLLKNIRVVMEEDKDAAEGLAMNKQSIFVTNMIYLWIKIGLELMRMESLLQGLIINKYFGIKFYQINYQIYFYVVYWIHYRQRCYIGPASLWGCSITLRGLETNLRVNSEVVGKLIGVRLIQGTKIFLWGYTVAIGKEADFEILWSVDILDLHAMIGAAVASEEVANMKYYTPKWNDRCCWKHWC